MSYLVVMRHTVANNPCCSLAISLGVLPVYLSLHPIARRCMTIARALQATWSMYLGWTLEDVSANGTYPSQSCMVPAILDLEHTCIGATIRLKGTTIPTIRDFDSPHVERGVESGGDS